MGGGVRKKRQKETKTREKKKIGRIIEHGHSSLPGSLGTSRPGIIVLYLYSIPGKGSDLRPHTEWWMPASKQSDLIPK